MRNLVSKCERCLEKRRRKETVSGIVVRPITVKNLNDRGQVDLVDMQSLRDGSFRFIMHYQEHLSKFHFLRPLTSKRAEEVASELLRIFLEFGAPKLLQSDNGREFTASVISELASLWNGLVLVNGRPRHPQSQGSVERSNATMKDSLTAWMRDNNCSKWSIGIKFVQWQMNTSYSEAIGMEPFKAMFGQSARQGLSSVLPREFLEKLRGGILEEDLEEMLREQQEQEQAEEPQPDEQPQPQPDGQPQPAKQQDGQPQPQPAEQPQPDGLPQPDRQQQPQPQPDEQPQPQPLDQDEQQAEQEQDHFTMIRNEAARQLKKQADRMLSRTNRKLRSLQVGDNVLIPVSEFDRGRGDPLNLIGVVLENNINGNVKVGTKAGVLQGWLSRSQVEFAKQVLLKVEDVPTATELTIRSAVRVLSVGNGQGYKRCQCKGSCLTKRCSCFKEGNLCISACHPRSNCKNKQD